MENRWNVPLSVHQVVPTAHQERLIIRTTGSGTEQVTGCVALFAVSGTGLASKAAIRHHGLTVR